MFNIEDFFNLKNMGNKRGVFSQLLMLKKKEVLYILVHQVTFSALILA